MTINLIADIIEITILERYYTMRKIEDPVSVVDADGVLISAAGAGGKNHVIIQSENQELVERVRRAAETRMSVEIIHGAKAFTAGWETPTEVLAALMAAVPGRSIILEAPQEALEALRKAAGPQDAGIVY